MPFMRTRRITSSRIAGWLIAAALLVAGAAGARPTRAEHVWAESGAVHASAYVRSPSIARTETDARVQRRAPARVDSPMAAHATGSIQAPLAEFALPAHHSSPLPAAPGASGYDATAPPRDVA